MKLQTFFDLLVFSSCRITLHSLVSGSIAVNNVTEKLEVCSVLLFTQASEERHFVFASRIFISN